MTLDADPLQPESGGLLRRGIARLRRLVLPSSQGLQIGDNFITAKDDGAGNIDPFWERKDGTETNMSDTVTPGSHALDSATHTTQDHDLLSGLTDDDHTQYLLATGTRTGASGQAQDFGSNGLKADAIAESTGAAGVTIDGALIKDLALKIDTITESTGNAGVTIEGIHLEDGQLQGNLVFDASRAIATVTGNLSLNPAGDILFNAKKLSDVGELIFTKSSITIASDEIGTVPGSTWVYLTGQGGANDDLKGIATGTEGQLLILTPTAGDDITLKHNAAVSEKPLLINGEADVTLDEDHDIAFAIYDATAAAWNVLVPGSGGGSVASDAIWDAAGDLAIADGANSAVKLSIGADHTILVSNGTTASWSAAPPLANIADTGDTNRITISTSSPEVSITGDLDVSSQAAIGGDASITSGDVLTIDETYTLGLFGVGTGIGGTIKCDGTQANTFGPRAIDMIASTEQTGGGVLIATGMQFTAQHNQTVETTTLRAFQLAAKSLGAGACPTMEGLLITNSVGASGATPTDNRELVIRGTTKGTNVYAIEVNDISNAANTTTYGLKIDDFAAGTNVYPLFIQGNSDDQDHYSAHEPNLVLFKSITAGDDFMGLSTGAKAGDGVLGWGDAATAPDEVTNPTGGLILWAAAGALFGIGSSGTKTTIAAAEPHCPECGNDFVLEWANKNQKKHLQVCMWCYASSGGAGVIKQEGL